ncbi:MAG: hypothetical protein KIS78_03290 [Labilithrix sp.]|nr:hypothetical protein [Labilithrix sp.]MCW5831467.1 hypothetical protein [Labilithrix sp.]
MAVATSAGPLEAGAPRRGRHPTKYNQLVRIEEEPDVLGGHGAGAGGAP